MGESRDAARPWGDAPQAYVATPTAAVLAAPSSPALAIVWAGFASTFHRIQRGEGALLAVNLSLAAYQGVGDPRALAGALVSVLAIGLMYALNDLYDAPLDWNNPKKDRALIATYLEHRRACALAIVVLKLATLALAFSALGGRATAAVAGVMVVNLVYSTRLKGVPVIDVAWCGLWGALYAAIVTASPSLLVLVGLMTAVCHLYQALDDRDVDAENAIVTTAVRSRALSRDVLAGLSGLLFVALRGSLGDLWAATAVTPLAVFFVAPSAGVGWLLTKVYFGIVWLYLLGVAGAAG